MSRKKIVDKEAGDSAELKKHSPRKWAATKTMTTAEILWHKVVDDEGHNQQEQQQAEEKTGKGQNE